MTTAWAGLFAAAAVASGIAALTTRIDPGVVALLPSAESDSRPMGQTLRLLVRISNTGLVHRMARLDRIEAWVHAAGRSFPVEDVVAAKVTCAVGVLLLTVVAAPSVVPVGMVGAAAAFVLPDFVLARAARARLRRIDREIPQFLDLLAAASMAGLSAPAAFRRAASGLRGPLSDELGAVTSAVDVGERWGEQLADLAERLQLPDLETTVTVIARTERLGISLSDGVRGLASDVREARRARAAERARTAPVKMLFPLVFMVLPAFLLLTVVPVLIATLRSLE